MSMPKRTVSEVITVLLLAVLLGSLLTCGCSPPPKITAESDPRVFTLFAGLAAVGYGEGQADPASETLRAQLKEALAGWTADDLNPMIRLEQTYRPDELVSATLQLGPPPDFAADEGSPTGLQAFLARFWAQVEPLYESSRKADAQALEAMAEPAAAVIGGAVDYTRGKVPCKIWKVVAEPLALPGRPSSYRDGATAWMVLSPAPDTWQTDLAREAYAVLVRDELARLQGEGALDRFQPVLQTAGFDGDLPAYLEENLVWALTARTLDGSDTKGALDKAAEQGFLLAPALCEKLADYEASGQPLRGYLGQLLGSIDVDKVLASTPPNWTKWYWGPPPIVQGWILRVRTEGTISFPVVGGAELAVPLGEGSETSVSLGRGAVDEGGTEWMVFWSQGWAETVVPGKITPTTREPGKMTLSGTGVIWAFHMHEFDAPGPPPWQITLYGN